MTYYLYDVAKSLGFGFRNEAKALNNGADAGVRAIVGGLQTTKAAASIFEQVKKYDQAAKVASKTANYLGKAVNPLLCVASVARVAASKDRPSAFLEESGAMGTMFAVESIMKSQFKPGSVLAESKLVKVGAEKLANFCKNTKLLKNVKVGAIGSILTGLAFIAGSILSYEAGHYIGKKIADNTTKKYSFINVNA